MQAERLSTRINMTLVIAGHNLEKSPDYSSTWTGIKDSKLKQAGLFVAADSAITKPLSSGYKTLLGGFKKTYSIPVKVWEPYFVGEYFHSYMNPYYEGCCFVAIAGSTLTAQHVMNSITEHLGHLRITHIRDEHGVGKYTVIRHCQNNPLEKNAGIDQWDENMFLHSDMDAVITADTIIDNIEYSIRESLTSAKQYKLDENDLNSMNTEFAAGAFCPVNKIHKLFTFRMKLELNLDGFYEIGIVREEIPSDKVAVLGMRTQFEARAQKTLDSCIQNSESTAEALFNFLNEAIDEVISSGNGEIDRPSVLKILNQNNFEKVRFTKR
jgi:hypothetical protein